MLNVLIAGDYCPYHRVLRELEQERYAKIFGDVKEITADYKIVNFESVVASSEDKPIEKCGPNLHCPENSIDALKYAGFDCVALANNHFYDYGQAGVKNTKAKLHEVGIDYVGGGENIVEAAKTLYKNINGQTIAIINCCEHEFSIATDKAGGSNPLNPIAQWYAIKRAKEIAKYIIVIVHGGPEYFALPTLRMVETYRFFIDAGADAVVNHHQHCMSGYEMYKEKPIFYGLGNFCFDWDGPNRLSQWRQGYMVRLLFDETKIDFETIPYYQAYNQAGVYVLKKISEIEAFNNRISFLNEIISDEARLKERNELFNKKNRNYYLSILEPYGGKIGTALFDRKLLPSVIKGAKKKHIENIILCESHRDKLLYALRMQDGDMESD